MELRDLNYLRAIATNGHLGRAAQSVGLTQPALTKCIARLEHELAVDLLERTPRGVRLTLCGEHLVAHAERLHAADADIRRQLREFATGEIGHIRIGTGLAASQHLLPKACIALVKRFPGVTAEISSGNSETLFPALREQKLDIVLASISAPSTPGLRQTYLMHDRIAVITRHGHPAQKKGNKTIDFLANASWAMPPLGTIPLEWLAQRFRDSGFGLPKCVVRTGTLPALLQIVAETDLVAFQSWAVVSQTRNYRDLLRPVALEALTWNRPIGAFTREHGYRPPVIDRLLETLREVAGNRTMTTRG